MSFGRTKARTTGSYRFQVWMGIQAEAMFEDGTVSVILKTPFVSRSIR